MLEGRSLSLHPSACPEHRRACPQPRIVYSQLRRATTRLPRALPRGLPRTQSRGLSPLPSFRRSSILLQPGVATGTKTEPLKLNFNFPSLLSSLPPHPAPAKRTPVLPQTVRRRQSTGKFPYPACTDQPFSIAALPGLAIGSTTRSLPLILNSELPNLNPSPVPGVATGRKTLPPFTGPAFPARLPRTHSRGHSPLLPYRAVRYNFSTAHSSQVLYSPRLGLSRRSAYRNTRGGGGCTAQ